MNRLIYSRLLEWKESRHRCPLVIRGVRQCGKTYIMERFGRENYEDMAYFSFEGNDRLQSVFEGDLDPKRIIRDINLKFGTSITEKTLIIFDEIQFSNRALTSLKYFCETAPEYHVMCAGSLLGLMLSRPLSFPVGKVDMLTLRPMNFREFLMAAGNDALTAYLDTSDSNEPVSDAAAEAFDGIYRQYMCVGGMPEAVREWMETGDMKKVGAVHAKILDSYVLDFAKHAPPKDVQRLNFIWRSIPGQLSKENRRFMFGHAVEGSRSKDLEEDLQWLLDAGMVYKVRKISRPSVPVSAYASEKLFKLYGCDVGLMRTMAGVPAGAILLKDEGYREFKGGMTENFVLTELVAAGYGDIVYWGSDNRAEVDFVVMTDIGAVPIEVKSETRVRAASLAEYIKTYDPRAALLISKKNLRRGEITYLPLWLAGSLEKYVTPNDGKSFEGDGSDRSHGISKPP
ncbi:MAG: ATP-binding protein [Candidatus Methanoplasma sp.]|jgi:predicted AAA+ superfamily ATPase|nr:ATP-binding protein [Candidatus Methanoplasma sp.]